MTMTDPPAVLSDRYRLDDEIGRGGAGRVYRAHDDRLDRPVAVKVLTDLGDTAVARFRREAATAARIRHPNVVTLHDAGVDEMPYLVMSLVGGRSLSEQVEGDGPLSVDELHRLATDMFAGLDATHQAGVLHRDLTPRNVLFDQDGRALLADFGIARGEDDPTFTAEHTIMGTRPFVAPERMRGHAATPKTDVYAVGVTLAYAATGQHSDRIPDSNPLSSLVSACTADDPDDRPSAREALRRLEAIATHGDDAAAVTAPLSVDPSATTEAGTPDGPQDPARETVDSGDQRIPWQPLAVLGLVALLALAAVVGSSAIRNDTTTGQDTGGGTEQEDTSPESPAPTFDPQDPSNSAEQLAEWLRERNE